MSILLDLDNEFTTLDEVAPFAETVRFNVYIKTSQNFLLQMNERLLSILDEEQLEL